MPKKTKTTKTKIRKIQNKNQNSLARCLAFTVLALFIVLIGMVLFNVHNQKTVDIDTFRASPFNVVRPLARPGVKPSTIAGTSPANIKAAYHIGLAAGSGTIAIIDAYDNPNIEADLGVFSTQYGLRTCTTANGCFEKHKMATRVSTSADWAIESSLDVEWAHAIAPGAKILLVESVSNSGTDLLRAIDYARARSDVVAISMSWGGDEFPSEGNYDSHFTNTAKTPFFASSGDYGHGVSWPAVSANIIGVGGTTVNINGSGNFVSETAWSGSGGGLSNYIKQPAFQTTFNVPSANKKRAVPDVSYDADPATGFPVYDSVSLHGSRGWFIVGGTSAGAPQWAAIQSIARNITTSRIYVDAAAPSQTTFRDIVSGNNGTCGLYCNSVTGYDYVTGVGSPLGVVY